MILRTRRIKNKQQRIKSKINFLKKTRFQYLIKIWTFDRIYFLFSDRSDTQFIPEIVQHFQRSGLVIRDGVVRRG